MTAPATSAATSAGEARRDAFGSDLGVCWPPLGSHRYMVFGAKRTTLERSLFDIRSGHGQFQTAKGAMWTRRLAGRFYRSTGGPGCARFCPVVPGRRVAMTPRLNPFPHAPVLRMAFAWSQRPKLPQTTTTATTSTRTSTSSSSSTSSLREFGPPGQANAILVTCA